MIEHLQKQQKTYEQKHNGEKCKFYTDAIEALRELKITREFIATQDLIYEFSCYAKGEKPDYMEGI